MFCYLIDLKVNNNLINNKYSKVINKADYQNVIEANIKIRCNLLRTIKKKESENTTKSRVSSPKRKSR